MLPDLHCATIGAMSLSSLYLAPDDPQSAPTSMARRFVLHELGLIGRPLAPKTYSAGEGFQTDVIYAGCSPSWRMQPSHDGSLQFCHVALHGPYAQPRLVTGPGTVNLAVRPAGPA